MRARDATSGYEVVLFDFDGTLCDTREAVIACMIEAVARRGGQAPTRQAVDILIGEGLTLGDTLRHLAGSPALDDPQPLIATYRSLYHTLAPLHSALYPGVKPLLDDLSRQCSGLVVVSNKGEAAILRTLAQFGIDAFDVVIAERPGLLPKPHPGAFFDIVARRFPTVLHDRFLMVGDTAADLGFARNAGIASCWAAYGYGDPVACRALAPDHTLAAFTDLRALVAAPSPGSEPRTEQTAKL